MDRKIYKLPIRKSGLTSLPCPTCNKGQLKVLEDTLISKETAASRRDQAHPAWGVEWLRANYSCMLECSNTACKENVASVGTGEVSEEYIYDDEGNPEMEYDEYFIPKYFSPHLIFFSSPKNTPDVISDEIKMSFSLLYADPASSANHIRAALEYLLTHLKIKRYVTNRRRRTYLALHRRIELLPRRFDHIRDLFFAIKWLGNAGSHSGKEVTTDDVFDAYELMEELLIEIFLNRRKKVKSLAKKINKKKGPK